MIHPTMECIYTSCAITDFMGHNDPLTSILIQTSLNAGSDVG